MKTVKHVKAVRAVRPGKAVCTVKMGPTSRELAGDTQGDSRGNNDSLIIKPNSKPSWQLQEKRPSVRQ